jgi:hypothetical protein
MGVQEGKSDCIQLSTQRTIETDHRELARRDIEQHTRQLLVRREIDSSASPLSSDELTQIDAWRRAANYLSVGQIYRLPFSHRTFSRVGSPAAQNGLVWRQLRYESVDKDHLALVRFAIILGRLVQMTQRAEDG